jgi:cell division septum initiation protein DivIVA
MFTNVKLNMREIADSNNVVYDAIAVSTNDARDLVTKVRQEAYDFTRRAEREKEDMKQSMYAQYIQYYNKTEASLKELQGLTLQYTNELASTKQQLERELAR